MAYVPLTGLVNYVPDAQRLGNTFFVEKRV